MEDRWYYLHNGRSAGPFSACEFKEFAAAGTVDGRTMVWKESLPDWLPLAESGLARVLDIPLDCEKNTREIARLNTLRVPMIILNSAAWVMTAAAAAFTAVFLIISGRAGEWSIPWAITALSVVSSAVLVWIGQFICGMIQICRAWKCIPPADAVMTPAKAVAGCCIPVLNIYWYFPAVVELAKLLNAQLVREEVKGQLVSERLCKCFAVFHALWWLVIPIPAAMICWCRLPGELRKGCVALKQNRMRQRLADSRKAVSAKESE